METGLGVMVLEAPAAGSADHPLRDLLKTSYRPRFSSGSVSACF